VVSSGNLFSNKNFCNTCSLAILFS
jgi:hypothetical protein